MLQIKMFTVNPVQENTYVIYDETGEGAIIDCGCVSLSEKAEVQAFIEENKIIPKLLLNTHLHFDHVWGSAWAMRTWKMQAYCHEKDLSMPPKPSEQLRMFGINSPLENLPAEEYKLLDEGDSVCFGNTRLEVRHIPGHAPGHIAFYCAEAGVVFSGDALFYREIGRTDLWEGSYPQLIESVRTRLFTLPEDTIVYPGHGPHTIIRDEIAENPYFQ